MRFSSILAAVAASSLVAAPVVAAPKVPAATAEVAPEAESVDGNQIRGGYLLPLAIIIAIILGVLLLTKDDEDPISA